MTRWLIALALVAALAIGWVVLGARQLLEPAAGTPRPELFAIEQGATMTSVARRLEEAGMVRSARAMRWLARWQDVDERLHVGEYELSPHESPAAILEKITTGDVKTWAVTVPEGSRIDDIADRLAAAGLADRGAFVDAATDPALAAELGVPGESLEGYLYPDTYPLPRGLPPAILTATRGRQV